VIKPLYQNWIKPITKDLSDFILDILFPTTCLSCEKEGNLLCAECQSALLKVPFQQCILCHKPSPLGFTHSGCKTAHGPDGLISVFDYHDDKISKSIIHGKYYFIKGAYRLLGNLAGDYILSREYKNIFFPPNDWQLVPIPLAKQRLRWRGFNQAEIICKALSEKLDLPVVQALNRRRRTKTQKDLKRDERIHNIEGAFAMPDKHAVKNQNCILVDDVVTTGSTILEAAKVLKRNGAKNVWCLTIARD